MADVELLIKISEETYEYWKNHSYEYVLAEAIKNGTPLPKHGDLIDRSDLLANSYCIDDWSGNEINIVDVMTIKMADTIIKADIESEGAE